jgi:transposase
MITNGVFYEDLGGDFYTKRKPDKTKQRALDQLRQMGYKVTLQPWKQPGREESSRRVRRGAGW